MMPSGESCRAFNSCSTAPVSCNRIATRPCACAPDAFRSGNRSGRSDPLDRLLGPKDVPLRPPGASLGFTACDIVCLTFLSAPGTSSGRGSLGRSYGPLLSHAAMSPTKWWVACHRKAIAA